MTAAPVFTDGVTRIASYSLRVCDRAWAFQSGNGDAIERHFRAALRKTPEFFNGRVFVLADGAIAGDSLDGTLLSTNFASYLYWRESGFDTVHGRDIFGTAIISGADGGLLLGRAARHTMNSGRADLVGGFIDPIDVGFDGSVDIDSSIAREFSEETGLSLDAFTRLPGYIVTVDGPLVSISVHYRSTLGARELAGNIEATLAGQSNPELASVVVVEPHQRADRNALAALGVPAYVCRLFGALAETAA